MPRLARLAALVSLALAACGAPSPTPEQLRATLVQHPEILYDAIRAHPAEFMAVIDSVARSASSSRQARTAAEEERRIDGEFASPRRPALDHRIAFGAADAPVTIVEYTDFECPYCREERPVLVDLMKKYDGRVRLVVKHTPMEFHPHAMPAARMFEAIVRQDPQKALRFYDAMYERQDRLVAEGERYVRQAAVDVGADLARAERDAASDAVRATIDADMAEARRFGFTGTPGFLINGVSLEGAYPLPAFERIIDRHLKALASP
jgi:protein-disulfide isomerase